jgi:hypothetical protein
LGGILLVVGFRRRPVDLERTNVPELAKGRPPGDAAIKARRAWMEIARLLYSAVGEHRVVSIAAGGNVLRFVGNVSRHRRPCVALINVCTISAPASLNLPFGVQVATLEMWKAEYFRRGARWDKSAPGL